MEAVFVFLEPLTIYTGQEIFLNGSFVSYHSKCDKIIKGADVGEGFTVRLPNSAPIK